MYFFEFIIFYLLEFFLLDKQTLNGVGLNALDFLIIFASNLELKVDNKLIQNDSADLFFAHK